MTPSTIVTYMNGVKKLGGTIFAKWKSDLNLILAIMDRDHSFREDKPTEPVAEGDNDSTLATRKDEYEKAKAQWERSDRVALMSIDHTINPTIRRALPKTPSSAKEFMTKIEKHFKGSSKANASMLMTKMMNAKYTSQRSVREHIMKLIDTSNKLKDLDMPLPKPYLVHYIMLSLPIVFDNFKINYNGSDKKWNLAELIAKCSQEEEMLRAEHKDFVNLVSQDFNKNYGHGKFSGKSSRQKKGKGKKSYVPSKKEGVKEEASNKGPKCHHCND
jgi:hypothetical protein